MSSGKDNIFIRVRHYLWWKFAPGTIIDVPWPDPINDFNSDRIDTDDYEDWLVANVGKRGTDWDWMYGDGLVFTTQLTRGQFIPIWHPKTIQVKFRKSKAKWATIASILWT